VRAEPAVARQVAPQLDDAGRTRERARWLEAVAAHVAWEDGR
jgi:hypothetical protein